MRAATSSIIYTGDSTSSVCSERSKQAIGQAKHLIGQISEEENLDRFDDEFSQKLIDCKEQT